MEFEQLKGGHLSAAVTGVADAVSTNDCDAGVVGFRLLGAVGGRQQEEDRAGV